MSNRLDIHFGRRGGHLQPGIIVPAIADALCEVCGRPMTCGQTTTHVVCARALDVDVDEGRLL